MTVDEVLEHLEVVVAEAKAQGQMPTLPVWAGNPHGHQRFK